MIKWLKDFWDKSGDRKFLLTHILPTAGLFFTWGFLGHLYMTNLDSDDLKEINGKIEWIGIVTESSISRSMAKYHPLKIKLQGQSDMYRLHDNFKNDFRRIQENLKTGDDIKLFTRNGLQTFISWGKTNDIFIIQKGNETIFGLERMIKYKTNQRDIFAGFAILCWTIYLGYIYQKRKN